MYAMREILKPINRGKLRQMAGREFYILKRKVNWLTSKQKWASQSRSRLNGEAVFEHRSLILRPLKDVDMHLQENKRTNLKLAIAHLNQTTIGVGQTFSFWKQVGRPTQAKGYLEGLVLNQGTIDKGIGGGLCQLGNLLFWIFAHSPLTVTERYRHGFDVFPDVNRKVPFGAGATLAYNYIDLQVMNSTAHQFQLHLWLDDSYLNGALISQDSISSTFRVEERNHIMKQQIWGGYSRHNQIFKIETKADGTEQESLLVVNHAIMMYNPFLSENSGAKI